ncbi:MAG: hypothetical protein JKP95_02565 [Oceanicaulis sp.]|nr:hypothetical protein [Oceanicaulis sp.]
MRALALGEETAQTLGVDLARTRVGVIGAAALLTARLWRFQGLSALSALSRPISCAPLCDMIRLIWSGRAPFWAGS